MIIKCPVCQSTEYGVSDVCRCSYNFKEDKITDKDKIAAYYKNIKETEHWAESIKFIENLHEFQQKKRGDAKSGASGGWGYKNTAKLLKEQLSIVSDSFNLAKASEVYPELLNCSSRSTAFQRRKKLVSGIISMQIEKYGSEAELQEYLETNWEATPLGEEWELKESQVNVGSKRRLDILAHHRTEDCWLVVELKKDESPDCTVGQILRYMGWIKENRAGKNEKVKGVIISGYPPDENIRYALMHAPDVDQKIYYIERGETNFCDVERAYKLLEIDKLPIDEIEKILNRSKKVKREQ